MAHDTSILIVRDDGKGDANPTFVIDDTSWFLLWQGLDGFDGINYEVYTEDFAVHDGAYLLGERSPVKDRTIEAVYIGNADKGRREAESFFRPEKFYDVHVTRDGRRRWFRCKQYAFALPLDFSRNLQKLVWTGLALDPYLLSEDEKSFNLAEAKGKFGFPFVSMAARWAPSPENTSEAAAQNTYGAGGIGQPAYVAGFVFGIVARKVNIDVEGNATVFPRFDIGATGTVVNPHVTVTDEGGNVVCDFGLAITMTEGQKLVVDFSSKPTVMELDGKNVSMRVTPGSTLIASLSPGRSTVTWTSDSGDASMSLTPTIRERYVTL